MSDVDARVREAIEEDIFLLVPLARGIVNHAALARWLQKHEGVGGEAESIAKYLREYTPSIADLDQSRIWEALDGAAVGENGPVSVISIKRSMKTAALVPKIFDDIEVGDQGEILRFIPTEKDLVFIVERGRDQAVIDTFEPPDLRKLERELVEYALAPTGLDIPLGGLLGVLIDALTSCGIEVRYAISGSSECFLLVSEEDGNDTFDILTELVVDVHDPEPPQA